MNEYDAALKLLLQASDALIIRQVTGGKGIVCWLNPEFQQVQVRRADLLGFTDTGGLVHIELQSTPDKHMPLRMAEYALAALRQHDQLPTQIVLYVGEPPLRMANVLRGPDPNDPDLAFRFSLVDIRDLDGAPLLNSDRVEDNVLAILTRLQNQLATVRHILQRIALLDEEPRRALLAQLLILSGLRRLAKTVTEEAEKMPLLNNILDHEVLGPAILQGRQEGRHEGRIEVLRRLFEKRFGPVPNWVEVRLASLSASEIDDVAVRLLDAECIDDLFPR